MNTQRAIHLLIYIVVIVWAVLLHIDHQTVHSALLKPLSDVTTAVLTLAMVFDLWIWRWPIFRGWLVKRPIIDGTWKVEMVSDWKNPETGEAAGIDQRLHGHYANALKTHHAAAHKRIDFQPCRYRDRLLSRGCVLHWWCVFEQTGSGCET